MTEPNVDTDKHFVLATDLDGTFLGGSQEDRLSLYRWIEDNRADVGLIFVSGRDLPFIEQLCDTTPVPWPDFVIGDVGTTIAHVRTESDQDNRRIHPLGDLESEIAAKWRDSGDAVRKALADAPGLSPQETPFRYRMSYHYDPETYDPAAEAIIRDLGLDVLISDDRFLDVLPKGVSKGPTLKRLIHWLGHDEGRILVAGDTMNDLSLFETGLKGVAVGNSEPALMAELADKPHVFRATGHGCAGIYEAIQTLDLFPDSGGKKHVV